MLSKDGSSTRDQAGDNVNGTALEYKHCCDTLTLAPRFYPYWGALFTPRISAGEKQLIPSKKKLRYSLEPSSLQRWLFVGNIVKLQVRFLASCRVLLPCWVLHLLPCLEAHNTHLQKHDTKCPFSGMWQSLHVAPGTGTWKWYRQRVRLPYKHRGAILGVSGNPAEPLYLLHVASLC